MRKKYIILAKAYDRKGNFLTSSYNASKKSHPVQKYFADKAGLPQKEFLHAEIRSLLSCKDKVPYTLTVERYNADGSMALAKPCPVCQEALKAYGVKKVRYTTDNGWVTKNVKDL